MPSYKPAPAETVIRRLLWVTQKLAHQSAPTTQPLPEVSLVADDPRLCTDDAAREHFGKLVRHRPVKEALVMEQGGRSLIGWRVTDRTDRHPDGLRTARLLDPEAAFVLDAALWFGGAVVFNPVKDEGGRELHYLNLYSGSVDRVSARRVLAATPPGMVEFGTGSHYDYSMRTIGYRLSVEGLRESGKEVQDTSRGREHLIRTALGLFDKNHGRSEIPLTRMSYERLLRLGFTWVDQLRDAEHAAKAIAAE